MRKIVLVTLVLLFLVSCVIVIRHDQDMAAKSAIEFAKVALVQHDIQNGYFLLSDNLKKEISLEEYSQVISQMHPSSYPIWLTVKNMNPYQGKNS